MQRQHKGIWGVLGLFCTLMVLVVTLTHTYVKLQNESKFLKVKDGGEEKRH